MDEQELAQAAIDTAALLPGVTYEHRENPGFELYKVADKLFMYLTDLPGHTVVTVKADPDEALALRERYEEITEGYHANKRHWVSAAAGPGIDQPLIEGLVQDSYDLVVAKLPKPARDALASSAVGTRS